MAVQLLGPYRAVKTHFRAVGRWLEGGATLVEVEAPPAAARNSRLRSGRVVLALGAASLLTAALATFLTLRHVNGEYGPLQRGAFWGVYSTRNFVISQDGFTYRLAATRGASGELIESLDNLGAHSVTITSVGGDASVVSIRWSVYRFVAGGSTTGVETPWQSFPARVPAHGTIRLLVTIQRPTTCSGHETYQGGHVVRWKSLWADHTTNVELLDDPTLERIYVC